MTAPGSPVAWRESRLARVAAVVAIAGVLMAVFLAYLSPHLVVELANRVWACL